MYDNNLVSVVIPAYNSEHTVSETIDSVLAQTYTNWEIVIVDDASTDNTLSVIKKYSNLDKRIRVFSLEQNSGSAKAKNEAIKHAKGRFIAFLDADDLWKTDKLEKQINFMQDNAYEFTFTSYELFTDKADIKRKLFEVPVAIDYDKYLRNTIIGNLTVILDRNSIKDVHVEEGFLEDVLTWMYFLRKGIVAHGLNENLASYRVYANSKSGNKVKNAIRYWHCLRDIQKLTILKSLNCELWYLFNAIKKRIFGKFA